MGPKYAKNWEVVLLLSQKNTNSRKTVTFFWIFYQIGEFCTSLVYFGKLNIFFTLLHIIFFFKKNCMNTYYICMNSCKAKNKA